MHFAVQKRIIITLLCAHVENGAHIVVSRADKKPEKAAFPRQNRPNEPFDVASKMYQNLLVNKKGETTMKRNKLLFVIAIVAMLAVLFVACDDGAQPEHTHTYGAWTFATAPTENAAGTAERVCSCGDKETVTVAKLTDASVWTVTVSQDATHESAGFKAYKSDAFGTVTLTFPKGQHAYGDWEISTDPTETTTGIARRFCACGHYEEVALAVLTNTSVWTKSTEGATHTTPGKEIYTSEYGVVTIVTSVEDHVYGAWSDNHDGTHTRTCECGDSQTENCVYNQEVPAPGFKKSDATCTDKAVYYKSCVCGAKGTETFEYGTANGHNYVGFQVTKDPTCTETGTVTARCSVCNEAYEGAIPALGHDFSGDCVPYVETISWGDEGGREYDGSEYHVHKCVRCDVVDSAHKEAHTFGEATYTLVSPVAGWHKVQKNTVCEDCGYKNVADAFNENYVESDSFFTKGEEKAADYNEKGYVEYTYKSTGETFRVYTDKLVAPYENVTYYSINLTTPETFGAVTTYDYTNVTITFDKNGNGTGNYAPVKGDNTIRITDATTGYITYVIKNGESVYNEKGGIDLEDGFIVRTTYGSWSTVSLMLPSSMAVTTEDVSGSTWTDSMAVSFNAKCSLNETHTFSVFVYDEHVYFGAQFVDLEGNAVAAKDCANSDYVKVLDAQGNKVAAFAQKNGTLNTTDGKEGTYNYADGTVVFNGVGGATIDGKAGFYTATADGVGYDYDVYVGESVDNATEYYRLTLGEDGACTLVKPMATLVFNTGVEGNDVADVPVNINVTVTLPVPADREGYMYGGWKLDGAGDATTTFKATEEGNEYRFETLWNKCSTIVANDLLDADKDNYNGVYVAVGSAYTSVLPAYTEDTFRNGYRFAGWYLDNGDSVLDVDEDQPLDDTVLVEEYDAQFVIFASWTWAGNVTFSEAGTYTFVYDEVNGYWKSNNQGKGGSTAVMEFTATAGVVHVSFEYKCDSESSYDILTIWYGPKSNTSVKMSGTSNSWKTIETTLDFSIDDSNQRVRFSYGKDGGGDRGDDTAYIRNLKINGVSMVAQTSLNKNAGVYTAEGAESINVGAGGVVTIGENSYTYSNVNDNTIGVMVGDVYREYTLNVAAKTYTVAEPKVNVSYNYNGHGENSTVAVGKYSNQTLASAPTADGFIFRGWYTDAELTTEAPATFVASSDVTFYAKWDAAITLTYVYLDGTTANVVVNLYANDVVETLQAVDFKYGTKVFAGWFTKDGSESGDYGTEFVKDTALTANTTVYAKWVEPSVFAGTYTVVKLASSGVDNVYNSDTTKIVVDAFGNSTIGGYNGFSYGNTVSFTFEEGSTTSVIVKVVTSYSTSTYKGVYDATSGTIVRADSTSGFGSTIYMMVPYDSSYAKGDFTAVAWSENSKYHKLVSFADKTADNAVRTIFVADSNTVAFDATWTAVKANDEAITSLANVKPDADQLTVVCGGTTYKYAKNSSGNFVVTDGNEGTYTSGSDSVRLNGAGKITGTFNGATISGTYTTAASDVGYGFDVTSSDKKATYTLSVNQADSTYTMAENKVTVTYVNDKVTVASASVFRNVSATLYAGDDLAVSGFKFRGWFDNAEFTGSAKTSVTPTGDVTFYAKYDEAVKLTFDYSGYEYESGKTSVTVADTYKNDKVSGIPNVASTVRYEGKAFAGWFLKNEDGSFGAEASTSTVLTGDLTYYAKWITPAASMGTYKGWNMYRSPESGTKAAISWSTSLLTINADGSYKGKDVSGKLTAEQMEVANGALVLGNGKIYYYFNVSLGMVWRADSSSNADGVGNDTDIGLNTDIVTSVDYSGCKGAEGQYIAYFKLTYKDGSTKYAFLYNSMIVEVSGFKDATDTNDLDVKNIKDTSALVYGVDNKIIAKVVDKKVVENDGKGGTYANADAYGDIVLNGYGTLTVNGASVAYTLDGNNVMFVANNAMRVVTLGSGTYTKALDDYQGTYTLPDGSTSIMLDGYGNVTGTTKTYVVNGSNVTIYDGETSTAYGIDVDGKTFLGKSVFAGLTYRYGTKVYDYIKFDDGVDISGEMGMGANNWITKFKDGVINGNELTVTVVSCNCGGISAGQTIVFTIDGDTLTIKSGKFNSNAVDVAVGYSYTLEK